MGENIFFQNVCRICTDETSGISIYSEEGKKNSLEEKIRKFLSITVTEEDILPKMVCTLCTNKLDSMDQFASMAAKMQTKLMECLNMQFSEDFNHGEEDGKQKERMAQWQSQFINGEQSCVESDKKDTLSDDTQDDAQGSLLHSILTKGQGQATLDVDVTELEVRVDPMLFLCDPDDEGQSNDGSISFSPIPSSLFSSSTSDESTGNSSDQERVMPKQGIKGKPYQCGLCPRSFYSDLSLQNHMWNHVPLAHKMAVSSDHNRDSGCVGGNADGGGLTTIQPLPVQWKCPICNKQISKNNLKVHLETHAVRGKHLCDICGRAFQTHTNLYRHKMYHTGSQCLCQVCGRVYPTRSTLRAHQITHSNLRPHKCSLCDKTFKRNQDLKFHINQHTGERPYRCPYCPKAFASSGNCFSHRKRMHAKQLARDKIKLLSARH